MSVFDGFLAEAISIRDAEPDDLAQGKIRITLVNGGVITGRVCHLSDGVVTFAEGEHSGSCPDFAMHVRTDLIATFTYT